MKLFIGLVVCFLCVSSLVASEDYRAAAVSLNNGIPPNMYAPIIHDAGRANVDILVLPAPLVSGIEDNYDETVKTISKATKEAGVYVVAHLFEKALCQNNLETISSNLVFDRQGVVVSFYRRPLTNVANCTTTNTDLVTFGTDFGATFGLLMEEDIVLHNLDHLQGLKNFVLTGGVSTEIPFFKAAQLLPSWSFINNVNVVSTAGIYGKTNPKTTGHNLVIADISASGSEISAEVPEVKPMKMSGYHGEDLSQYIIRPLNLEASIRGYKETICHGSFCCVFNVKTSDVGPKANDVNYVLAAFDGVRHYSGNHNIGTQNCAVFACAGLYKRSCDLGSENNNTNIYFERISISANFTKLHTIQYPVIQSTKATSLDRIKFDTKMNRQTKSVTSEICDIQNLLSFGIFGRDFSKDYDTEMILERNDTDVLSFDIYDVIYSEDVQEFVDYIWIRLRVLIFIVSIYILEMM